MNWRDGESNQKILQHSASFFPAYRSLKHVAALKIERKMQPLVAALKIERKCRI